MEGGYRGNKLLIFTCVFLPVQTIFVVLRFVTGFLNPKARGWDDYVVLLALAGQLAIAGTTIACLKQTGLGYHLSYLEEYHPEKLALWPQYTFALTVLYNVFVNVPKFAILVLYNRLFPRPLSVNFIVHCMMVYHALETVVLLIVTFTICRPLSANFEISFYNPKCGNRGSFDTWASFPNIISDVIILILPTSVVWTLHIQKQIKIGLVLTFIAGGLGLVTSILRFVTFFEELSTGDVTWIGVNLNLWTQVEIGAYIMCACLPTYRRFLDHSYRTRHPQQRTSAGTIFSIRPSSSITTHAPLQAERKSNSRSGTPESQRNDGNGNYYLTDTYPLTSLSKNQPVASSYSMMRRSSVRLDDDDDLNSPTTSSNAA